MRHTPSPQIDPQTFGRGFRFSAPASKFHTITCAPQEKARLLQGFYTCMRDSIKSLPHSTTSNLKQALKVKLAAVADIHARTQRLQNIMDVSAAIDQLTALKDIHGDDDSNRSAWRTLATVVEGAHGCMAEAEDVKDKIMQFVSAYVALIGGWKEVDSRFNSDRNNIVMRAIAFLEATEELVKAKDTLRLAAFAVEVSDCIKEFESAGEAVSTGSTAQAPHPAFAALIRLLQKPPPSGGASVPPALQGILDAQLMLAKDTRRDAELAILKKVETSLTEAIEKFTPMAGGAANGQSWKQKLKNDAPLKDVTAHYLKTLKKANGEDIYRSWQALGAALKVYESSIKAYSTGHTLNDSIRLRSEALLRRGRGDLRRHSLGR